MLHKVTTREQDYAFASSVESCMMLSNLLTVNTNKHACLCVDFAFITYVDLSSMLEMSQIQGYRLVSG